jgi:hypothetical protein
LKFRRKERVRILGKESVVLRNALKKRRELRLSILWNGLVKRLSKDYLKNSPLGGGNRIERKILLSGISLMMQGMIRN